jgi:hypothetical protein
MNLIAVLSLSCLLQQATVAEPPATRRQAPPEAPPAAPGDTPAAPQPEPAPVLDLARLLEDPEMQLTAISALEAEVESLRKTLGSLVSTGEMGVDLLAEVSGPAEQLRTLGVSEERTEAVRLLSNDVSALRARLRLLDLRAPADTKVLAKDSNGGFDPLEDQATAEAEALAIRYSEERSSGAPSPRRQRSLYPNREALLAFRQGEYRQVVETLEPFELYEIQVDALYAFGCALIGERDFERARKVFERVKSFDDRQTLRESSERQLDRIAHLENGIVGPGAQLPERPERMGRTRR